MFKKKEFIIIIFALIFALSNFIFIGCKDDTVSTTVDNIDLSSMATADTADAGSIIHIQSVKMLLKDIKLNVSNSQESNFRTGPFVMFIDVNSSVNVISSAFIPDGTYDKIKFEIHKPANDETLIDPDFEDVNGRYSIIVRGTYNGADFIYKSKTSAHQILSFPGNLHISGIKSNITLQVRPYLWFIVNGNFVDPVIGSFSNDIDNNIRNNINNNFRIFLDNNRDGNPDN